MKKIAAAIVGLTAALTMTACGSVESADNLPSGFSGDAKVRLNELARNVRDAEHLIPEQRRLAYGTVEEELDTLGAEIAKKSR